MDTSEQMENLKRMYDVCGSEMNKLKSLIEGFLHDNAIVCSNLQRQLISEGRNDLEALKAYNEYCKEISDLSDSARKVILELYFQGVRRRHETLSVYDDTRSMRSSRSPLEVSRMQQMRDVMQNDRYHHVLPDQRVVQVQRPAEDSISETRRAPNTEPTQIDLVVQQNEPMQGNVISNQRESTPSNGSENSSPVVSTRNQSELPTKDCSAKDRESTPLRDNNMRNLDNGDAARQNELVYEARRNESVAKRQDNFNSKETTRPATNTPLPAKGNARTIDFNPKAPEFTPKATIFNPKTPEFTPVRVSKRDTPSQECADPENWNAQHQKSANHPENWANAKEFIGRQSNESNIMHQERTTARDYGREYASPERIIKHEENSTDNSPNRIRDRDVTPSSGRRNANDASSTTTSESSGNHPQNGANASEWVPQRLKYKNEIGSVVESIEKEFHKRRSSQNEFARPYETKSTALEKDKLPYNNVAPYSPDRSGGKEWAPNILKYQDKYANEFPKGGVMPPRSIERDSDEMVSSQQVSSSSNGYSDTYTRPDHGEPTSKSTVMSSPKARASLTSTKLSEVFARTFRVNQPEDYAGSYVDESAISDFTDSVIYINKTFVDYPTKVFSYPVYNTNHIQENTIIKGYIMHIEPRSLRFTICERPNPHLPVLVDLWPTIEENPVKYKTLPPPGEVFALQKEGLLFRAVRENCTRHRNNYLAYILEFGVTSVINCTNEMFYLPKSIREIPAQAIHCKLVLDNGGNNCNIREFLCKGNLTNGTFAVVRKTCSNIFMNFVPSVDDNNENRSLNEMLEKQQGNGSNTDNNDGNSTRFKEYLNGMMTREGPENTRSTNTPPSEPQSIRHQNSTNSKANQSYRSSSPNCSHKDNSSSFPTKTKGLSQNERDMLYEEPPQTTNALKAVMGYHPKDEERICKYYDPRKGTCFKGSNCTKLHVNTLADGWTKDTQPVDTQICVPVEYPAEGSIIQVIPTYVANACSFYAQIESNNSSNNTLFWSALEIPERSKLRSPPLMLEMVLSQFTDGNWYRAQVLECYENESFHVFYVDYGNEDVVPLNRLASWNKDLATYAFQAYKCRIAGIRSATTSLAEKEEAKVFLGNILLDRVISLRVLRVTDELVVDIVDSDLSTLPQELINHKYAVTLESGF